MSDRSTQTGQITSTITVADQRALMALLGSADENLRYIERRVPGVDVHVRGDTITITGVNGEALATERLLKELLALIENGQSVDPDIIRRTADMLRSAPSERPVDVLSHNIVSRRGKTIRPKTLGQKRYVEAIDQHTIVFGIGPAGTGKTYLAMAKAVQALQAKEVNRIILTRPAVEAGEKLGFLPGTLDEKIDPYLRPLYDALHDMVDPGSIPKLMEAGTIEVAPLAYMRGRAHSTDTGVLTPDGWRPIGMLEVGDLVVGSNGEPTPVLGVYPQGRKQMYRLTTQDGASVRCCGEHLWAVKSAAEGRPGPDLRILQTQEMIGDLGAEGARRYELPLLSGPVLHPEREVPMDPYRLGRLMGDGGSPDRCPSSVAPEPEPAASLVGSAAGTVLLRRDRYRDRPAPAVTEDDFGSQAATVLGRIDPPGAESGAKRVPEEYLCNSPEVRLALLQGLLDAGGDPVAQPNRTCLIRYTTASVLLRDDVIELVRSFGGVADLPGRQDAHAVDIRLPEGIRPFRLERKLEEYLAAGGGGRPVRFIESIEPAGEAEAVCIQVGAADSLYVTEDHLVTHNTLNDAFIILDEAQNTTPEQMKMFLTRLGFGSKIVVTGDITQIDLPGHNLSGLRAVREILQDVDDVYFGSLTAQDVVRHQLVSDIVTAYERWDAERANSRKGREGNSGHRDRQ